MFTFKPARELIYNQDRKVPCVLQSENKYFYVLRPILVINWIERGYGVAPTALGPLVERLVREPELLEAIQALIVRKSQGKELDKGPRLPVLSEFIEKELARLEQGFNAAPNQPPVDEMDELFWYALSLQSHPSRV